MISKRAAKHTPAKREPKPRPSVKEMEKAWGALDAYFLHFYQLLYFHNPKLTEPGNGRPFNLKPSVAHHHCIQVECQPWTNSSTTTSGRREEFDFLITSSMTDEEVPNKCRAIMSAIAADKQKVHGLACCPLAAYTPCVCAYSFKCPIHGEAHIGTHD